MGLKIIILAAGQSKRMHTHVPKVLHCLGGMPMLERIYHVGQSLDPEEIFIVCGHEGLMVKQQLAHMQVTWVEQAQRLGTGHAVAQVLPQLHEEDHVLVLVGDIPLITKKTLEKLTALDSSECLGIITTEIPDPTGFGRIVRDSNDEITSIIEHKDATLKQRKIKEVNTGIMIMPVNKLRDWLPRLSNHNAQNEYYLTDCIAMAVAEKYPVQGVLARNYEDVLGVNDRLQLATLERIYQKRVAEELMLSGVTFQDPARFDCRGEIAIEEDVFIDINVILEGKVQIGRNVRIGPGCILRDCTIESDTEIRAHSVIDGAHIGVHCIVGPFARIRPGTVLNSDVTIGNFVEIKKSQIGSETKISHLSYIGDSLVGHSVNIGAGTITCNYDGVNKHQTIIEDRVFIGSDTQLIAPVRVGADAMIAAGTTVTKDAPAEHLTLSRVEQKSVPWRKAKRPIKG